MAIELLRSVLKNEANFIQFNKREIEKKLGTFKEESISEGNRLV